MKVCTTVDPLLLGCFSDTEALDTLSSASLITLNDSNTLPCFDLASTNSKCFAPA